jgi:hypothetical protein
VSARLADVHLDLLAVDEELAEIAEEEAPTPAALVEISFADERERRLAANAVEAVLLGDAASLGRSPAWAHTAT